MFAVAWFIGTLNLKDSPLPPGVHPAEGYVTHIEKVHFSKGYTYIHLDIKTGSQTETWAYLEDLQRFAPALKSLRVGDFVKALIVPKNHGKATSQIIELRRGGYTLLTVYQARAYRIDEIATTGVSALICGAFAVTLGFIARVLRIRAENPPFGSQTIAEWFAHLSWTIYGGALLLIFVVSAYFLYSAGSVNIIWVLGSGIVILGLGARRAALQKCYIDDNCCLHCGAPLGNAPALRFIYGRFSGKSYGYCLACAPAAQLKRYLIGGIIAFGFGTVLLMAVNPAGMLATLLALVFDLTLLPMIVRWMFGGEIR